MDEKDPPDETDLPLADRLRTVKESLLPMKERLKKDLAPLRQSLGGLRDDLRQSLLGKGPKNPDGVPSGE